MMASSLGGLLRTAADQSNPSARDAAFAELLRLVGIYVRAGMGRAMRDRRESMDVCQSVAKSFIDDMAAGRLAFDNEAAVAAYLQKVVKSKLAELAREDRAKKRGGGVGPVHLHEGSDLDDADQTAVFERAGRAEDWERTLALLSADEQQLVALRRRGVEWEQIAAQLGRDATVLRKQYSRLQKRVLDSLRAHDNSGGDSDSTSAPAGSV